MPGAGESARPARSRLLWAASVRHLLHHPAQLTLALLGLSLGVATITAVDIATASSRRAFELSMAAIQGAATHQIVGGPRAIDERLYPQLRRQLLGQPGAPQAALAPIIEGYVTAGDRTLELIGLDPFASAELNTDGTHRAGPQLAPQQQPGDDLAATAASLGWFTQPGAVALSERTARQLGLATGASFTVQAGGARHPATLIGEIHDPDGGYDTLILTDIAQAQEWLGMTGRLSRIDLRVPTGAPGEQVLARLRQQLPAGLQVDDAAGSTQESLDMTGAFTTNLKAMSLLALLVSALLIYGAISFAVVQRRRLIGILRALGATRAEVLTIVLAEAAVLGLIGAALGLALGAALGQGLVKLVSQTINDLYFVVEVNQTTLPVSSIVKALAAGLGTALAAGLLPALEVAASTPQLGLRRSSLESRAVHLSRRLLGVSALLAAGAGISIAASGRSLMAGFLALFLLLLSVAAVTPAVLRGLALAAARLAARVSPVVRLAFAGVAASLSRTAVAVAALGMAVAAMIGVSIMVASFRESLWDWLGRTMRSDIYITAPGLSSERSLQPAVISAVLATPGIVSHTETRSVEVQSPAGPLDVNALQRQAGGGPELKLAGESTPPWDELEHGAVVVSEPLAWRLKLSKGDTLTLSTALGPTRLRIAGIYRDYGTGPGSVLMSLGEYRRLWRDDSITGIGLSLSPGVRPAQVIAALRAATRGRQALLIRSNADLRARSMSIFDRTFTITRVLNWLAAGVAAVGLVSSLLAWELERSHELAVLRALGLTPARAAVLIEAQTGFMGLAALIAAIPAGLLTAVVLTDVINRRAFGWHIDLHLSVAQLSNALLLSLTAALAAGLYPAWRTARAPIAGDIREE